MQPEVATTESSAPEIQLASALVATNRAPTDPDTIDVGAQNASLAAGDNDQRFYIYAYGEQAGNHTISDLSAGDKVYIWVEEGSSEEYTYTTQGADTLVSIGRSSILLKNVSPDNLRDFVFVEQNFVFTIDPIEHPIEIIPPPPADTPPNVNPNQAVVPPAEADGDTIGTPPAEATASETSDSVPAGGDEPQRFVVFAYGEQAGNHTISDFSAGDRLYIWTQEGSGTDYRYEVRGSDTLITIGQSTILLQNYVSDDLRKSVFADENATVRGPVEDDWQVIEIDANQQSRGTAPIDDPVELYAEPPGFISLHVYGTAEADLLFGDGKSRAFFAGAGDDTIAAGRSDVVLSGEDGDDLLVAHSGRSTLFGDGGNDTIIGSFGDDQIEGGSGNNFLIGGSGSDQFVYWGPLDFDFTDTIADFGADDRISIFPQNEPIDVSFERQDTGTLVKIGQSSVLLENFFAENVRDFVTVHDDIWLRIDRLELTPSGELIW